MIKTKEDDPGVIEFSEEFEVTGFLLLKDNETVFDARATDNKALVSCPPQGTYYVLPYLINADGQYQYFDQESFEV